MRCLSGRPVFCIADCMDPAELLTRAERFALASLAFYRALPKAMEAQVPGVQFYKAATSAWANYRSSKRGRSRPDFISKLGIAVEEIDEALGWLEFMDKGRIARNKELMGEARELCAILTASLKTSRENWLAELAARRRQKKSRSIAVRFPDPPLSTSGV
jgi:four helix bundle protein